VTSAVEGVSTAAALSNGLVHFPTISDVGIISGGHMAVQGVASLTHHGVLRPDERLACTRHVREGRSLAVVLRLRLPRRQDQIAEQPSHQPCQRDRPGP
jgi:hypothetical protein